MRAVPQRSTRTRTRPLNPDTNETTTDSPLKRTRSIGSLPSSPRGSTTPTPLSRRIAHAPQSTTASVRPANKDDFNPIPEASPEILSSPTSRITTQHTVRAEDMSTAVATAGALPVNPPSTSHTPQRRIGDRLKNGHASDSSSLTEVELDDDSEAETEKLENSPQKRPPRILQQPGPNDHLAAFTVKSALANVATPDDNEDEDENDDAASRETSPPDSPSPSRKRKRDQTKDSTPATSSELAIPKKAKGTLNRKGTPSENGEEKEEDKDDVETINGQEPDGALHDDVPEDMDIDEKEEDDKASHKDDSEAEDHHDNDHEDSSSQHEDKATEKGDDDNDIDDTARDDEEARKHAMEALTEIELDFAKLRDKLYDERAAEIDHEIAMVENGTHPQLIAMLEPVDRRRDEQVALANAKFNYSVQSLYVQTKATRAQICSQFLQSSRKLREEVLMDISEMWYQIQRERRANDTLVPEYVYKLPEKKSTRIAQRRAYDAEVAQLADISKTVGFPAAPEVSGLKPQDLQSDLEAMGLSARPTTTTANAPPNASRIPRRSLQDEHLYIPGPNPGSPQNPPAHPHHHHHHHQHQHAHIHHHHPHPAPPSDLPFRRPPLAQQLAQAGYPPQQQMEKGSIPPGLPPSAILRPHQQVGRQRQLSQEEVMGLGLVNGNVGESPFAGLTTQVLSGKQRY